MVLILIAVSFTICNDILNNRLLFSIYCFYYTEKNPTFPSEYTTQNDMLTPRQAIYYTLIASSGGTQSGNHKCSVVTLQHHNTPILISHPGCVYFSCSQHLQRTGSSYQLSKQIWLLLLIWISVTLVFQ